MGFKRKGWGLCVSGGEMGLAKRKENTVMSVVAWNSGNNWLKAVMEPW